MYSRLGSSETNRKEEEETTSCKRYAGVQRAHSCTHLAQKGKTQDLGLQRHIKKKENKTTKDNRKRELPREQTLLISSNLNQGKPNTYLTATSHHYTALTHTLAHAHTCARSEQLL